MESKTIVCISCYYKGYDFMEEMHQLGNKVLLITSEKLQDKNWPKHAIEEMFYMAEDDNTGWNLDHLVRGFSHIMKTRKIDAVIALDDYDVEKAALIRETFRIPGMGQTTHRYFRDKLAMRQQAKDTLINVPEYTSIFNNDIVSEFSNKTPAPWVLKPRSEASASGIKKLNSSDELWSAIECLGDERHLFLLESFKPGTVFHVDSLVYNKEIIFTCCSQYLAPPMKVSHEGGVFRTRTLNRHSKEYTDLQEMNSKVLKNFGLVNGATHTEFIKGDDGQYYFLETSSRVGGAHIPDMIEASTGINIWREWAKLEDALLKKKSYEINKPTGFFAGLILSLANEKHPNTEPFNRKEVVKFIPMEHHIGIVFKSSDEQTILDCLDDAAEKINNSILQILPPLEKPCS